MGNGPGSGLHRQETQEALFYLPYSMVHVPLFASDAFIGKSGAGLLGDVIMELDDSIGKVVDKLHEYGIADNTFIVFTSDNGPWVSCGDHAGSAGPYREAKGTSFEGESAFPRFSGGRERFRPTQIAMSSPPQ